MKEASPLILAIQNPEDLSARHTESGCEIDTLKWILAKRFPERWAERVKNEHTGKNGDPIKSEAVITPEVEEKIAKIAGVTSSMQKPEGIKDK